MSGGGKLEIVELRSVEVDDGVVVDEVLDIGSPLL